MLVTLIEVALLERPVEEGDEVFSFLTKNRVSKGGQKGYGNLLGREIPWVFFRFRFEAKDDGLLDTRFDDGASSDPDGPDDKDFSTVPEMLVYRRYFDLSDQAWKVEKLNTLTEDRNTFFSIGNPIQGAAYVVP